MKGEKKVRIQLDVPDWRVAQLDKLQEQCGLATRKDLYETALDIFFWALEETLKGRLLGSRDAKEEFHEITMPALRNALRSVPQERKEEAGTAAPLR